MKDRTYHGGAFFDAIGSDFQTLENSKEVIGADTLDAWFDPSPKVIQKVKENLIFAIKTSPPTHSDGLIKVISEYRGIPKKNILVAGGSSDVIFTFFPTLIKAGDSVLILDPMYGEYVHIFEKVIEAKVSRHTLSKENKFKIDPEKLSENIKQVNPKMVVIVNPNSPTGQYFDSQFILEIVKSFPEIIFVIDETYIEYVGKEKSLEKSATEISNLVIIKSMSKSYALSGARVGYLVANENIINEVTKFIPPWAASLIGQMSAVEALKDEGYYLQKYQETHELRKEMIQELSSLNVEIYDSVANFFIIELKDKTKGAEEIIQKLREQKIYLRNCDSMGTQFNNDCIRIAVKNREDNNKIISALKNVL